MSKFQRDEFLIMTDSDATMDTAEDTVSQEEATAEDTDEEDDNLLWQRDELNETGSSIPRKKCRYDIESSENGVLTYLAYETCDDEVRNEVRRRRKSLAFNLIAIAAIYLLQTIALPLYNINVISLHITDKQILTIVLSSLYCCTIFSCLISPFIIQRLDAKIPIASGCIGTALYVCSRFAPHPFLVITAAVLAGLTQGLFLTGVGISIISVGSLYTHYGGGDAEFIQYIFSGLANMWFMASPIWNSLLRLLIGPNDPYVNAKTDSSMCGKNFTWDWTEPDEIDISGELQIQALLGTHLVCALGALLICSFSMETITAKVFPRDTLNLKGSASCWVCSNKPTLLIIPSFFTIGCMQFFAYSVFFKAIGECSLSFTAALYLIIITSSSSICSATPIGILLKHLGRVKCVLMAVICDISILIVVLVLDKWHISVYIIFCVFRGLSDGIYHTAFTGMLPLIFKETSNHAIANFHTFKTAGIFFLVVVLRLGASVLVITSLLIALLVIMLMTYIPMEILVRLEEQGKKKHVHSGVIQQKEVKSWLPVLNPSRQDQNIFELLPKEKVDPEENLVSNVWAE